MKTPLHRAADSYHIATNSKSEVVAEGGGAVEPGLVALVREAKNLISVLPRYNVVSCEIKLFEGRADGVRATLLRAASPGLP